MQLLDLIRLRKSLIDIDITALRSANAITKAAVNTVCSGIDNDFAAIDASLDNFEKTVQAKVQDIEQQIDAATSQFLARGYIVNGFFGSNHADVPAERNDRQQNISQSTRDEVTHIAGSYTNWMYPTLEIGPGDGAWTDCLVASDPLYLVDVFQEFLTSTLGKYNPVYQGRLRPYLIGMEAGTSDTDLSALPKNQFGFIFAWNVFTYFPLAHTQAYLTQCYQLLRPGGSMMFSYNDCDTVHGATYAVNGVKSWMPNRLLVKTCKDIGFEITAMQHREIDVSWIEIKKPGTLQTVKAHQVLGEIIHRTT